MKRLEHSLSMKDHSWHVRWYRYWVSLGGKEAEYKENFCRYVRVLLFWAPQRWFWQGKIKGVLPPWVASLAAMVVAFIVTAAVLWTGTFLEVLLVVAGVAIVLGAVIAFVYWADQSDENEEKAIAIVKWSTSPVWIFPYAFYCAGERLWEIVSEPVEGVYRWFFDQSYIVEELTPFAMSVIVAAISCITLLAIFDPIVLLVIGIFIGVIAAMVGIFIGLVLLDDAGKLNWLKSSGPKLLKKTIEGTTDTVKLGYTYVKVKKEGSVICPFIELEKTEASTS